MVSIVLVLQLLLKANSLTVFDITKYGATPDRDISEALLKAWNDAIASTTASQVLIPEGNWTLSQVRMLGRNKAPINLEIKGDVKAYPELDKLPDKDGQWITINYVDSLTISGGGVLDGQGQEAWKANHCNNKNKTCPKLPINLSLNFITNSIIRDITTKDSKNWHANCISSLNVTFQRFTVSAPGDSVNTDGLHIARGHSIKVLDSVIGTGDDCISMGDELSDVLIKNVTCGPGHGISIGSLGKNVNEKRVYWIRVEECTFINTQNGIRIKTWPSEPGTITISDLHFNNLTMVNAANPVVFDQKYCPSNLCSLDTPSLIQISDVEINNVTGTSSTSDVMSFICSEAKPCQNIRIGTIDLKYIGQKPAPTTTKCENIKPIFSATQNPPVCSDTSSFPSLASS
ncbi:galacturonan 1,4-alpha-galacturonidase [Salvia divinorum]|uniref:Galacturonan 1,4-alpha-galacturonidase n=1 Tax=Salvia divinorum TaxID=28513 RepID=A0ABD1G7P7_SALDI